MSNTEHNRNAPGDYNTSPTVDLDVMQPAYASDIQILVEPGGIHLIFRRFVPATTSSNELARSTETPQLVSEVIGRVVLPPRAAERLLRLLPDRLADQRQMADAYAQATERDAESGTHPTDQQDLEDLREDPFLAALAAAELDDEPYTDEQQALSEAGWQEVLRGETVTIEELKKQLANDPEAKLQASR